MALRQGIFIVGAKRTPFGNFGGKLKDFSATQLAVVASKAAISECGVDPSKIGEVFIGNVIQSSEDACYLSRHVGLKSGVNLFSPALTLNRLCGSGFEAVIHGAEGIELGRSELSLCGGTENMSQAPMVLNGNNARWGTPLGAGMKLEDSLWAGLTDSHIKTPMGITAENLAVKYGISREECDEYALRSQQLAIKSAEAEIFAHEIVPVEVKSKKGMVSVGADEGPRADASLDRLSKLKPVFKPGGEGKGDPGVVTAGNASGITDGAASLIIASESAVAKHNLQPLCRIVGWSRVGCEPEIMGIGPVNAIKNMLAKNYASNVSSLADVDRVEVNEAFAAQYLACQKELGLDPSVANLHGGAIALGHPLGASGARITAHLAQYLHKGFGKKGKYAIGSACIGGGQGIGILLEAV